MRYLLVAMLCLVACHSRPNHYEVKLQDGTPGYRLDCDKTEFSIRECVKEASRLCGKDSASIMDDSNNGINTIVKCSKN